MTFGWAGKILHVDLSNGEISTTSSSPYLKNYIGGRMLAARLAWENIPKNAGPYDDENTIIITAGPLSGTIAPTSGRTVMSMISPVPYPFPWYTHSTIGGWFAPQMKAAGFDAILIRGKSPRKVFISIKDGAVSIEDASAIWGRDAVDTQLYLKDADGPDAQIMTIGPAGEAKSCYATVQHDFENAAGHSGFGAVWGDKNLKAISVNGSGEVEVARPQSLLKEWRNIGKFRDSPDFVLLFYNRDQDDDISKQQDYKPICSQSCVQNCHVGNFIKTADGRTLNTFCLGLEVVATDPQTEYDRPDTDVKIPLVKSYSKDAAATLLDMFNRLGIDYWMRITFHSWFTALKTHGIDNIQGYPIDPDNSEWFIQFVSDIACRQGLGEVFSSGFAKALDTLDGSLPEEMIRLGREIVFGFGFQAHREGRFWDNEPLPYWIFSAMMYLSETRDPTIGTHALMLLAEIQLADQKSALKKFRKIAENMWNDPDALEPNYDFDSKARVAIWSQRMHQLNDSLPLCDMAFPCMLKPYQNIQDWEEDDNIAFDQEMGVRLLNAVTGEDFDMEDLNRAADRAFFIERCLLARAGRSKQHEERLSSHFELPCRDDGTRVTRADFQKMMEAYYQQRGWDLNDGWPTREKLTQLDLEDVADELASLRRSRLG